MKNGKNNDMFYINGNQKGARLCLHHIKIDFKSKTVTKDKQGKIL
jgi:hypothetical protein